MPPPPRSYKTIKKELKSILTSIVKLAAVIRRGEECDELPLGEELVAILHHLVRATDQVELVLRQELAYHLQMKTKR